MAGQTIYTDLSGTSYDLPGLQSAWNDPTFNSDPSNARVGDILSSYSGSSAPAPTDTGGRTARVGGAPYDAATMGGLTETRLGVQDTDPAPAPAAAPAAVPAAAPAPSANVYAAAPLSSAVPTPTSTTGTDVNPDAYTPPPITIDPATTANNQALRDFMTSQLAQLSTPMDVNNPEVKPAIDAFNAQQQRDLQTNRDATAERYYASSPGGGALDSGGFNTAVQQQQEAAAADKANFSGSTIYNAAQAQRQQLQAMLGTAVQAGQTDVAQQIQAQIANIDAGLREQGLGQQNTQFNNTLDYNYANLIAQMNRDALIAGLTGQ